MANDENIQALKSAIEELLTYKEKELIKRPEWGEINFEQFEFSFQRLWEIVEHLNVLPTEYLIDTVAKNTSARLLEVKNKLDGIDQFSLTGTNPTQTRDQLGNQLNQLIDQLYNAIAIWIPFLAYQKGDVSKNIQELSSTVEKANKEVEKAKEDIEKKHNQIDDIITKAREASATAGAAVFTEDFLTESEELNNNSWKWLIATIGLAILTAIVAVYMWFEAPEKLTENHIWLIISTKLTIFILLFSATIWTGKIYRALKHQAFINKRRALGLKTFQAFSSAASDDQVKDAVLMETTRSIFANGPTGFIDSHQANGEADAKVIEVVKSVIKGKE